MKPLAAYMDTHGRKHLVILLRERVQNGGYLQALGEQADNGPTGAWQSGKLFMLVLGNRHMEYTEFGATDTLLTGFIYKK